MKKIFVIAMLCVLALPTVAHAQPNPPTTPPADTRGGVPAAASSASVPVMSTLTNPLKVNSLTDLYNSILKIIIEIGYVVVAFFLLLSGFKFVTAQGNPAKLDEAKSTFYGTIVGAIIVIGAQTIFVVLKTTLEGLNRP